MFPNIAINLFLAIAAIPFIYYLLALYSSWNYFHQRTPSQTDPNFTPPISNLIVYPPRFPARLQSAHPAPSAGRINSHKNRANI